MGKKQKFLQGLTESLNLPAETLAGITVAEVWGDGRVLVENHSGIISYGQQEILIGASYGMLKVSGEGLKVTMMTGEQLILSGTIGNLEIMGKRL